MRVPPDDASHFVRVGRIERLPLYERGIKRQQLPVQLFCNELLIDSRR